MRLGGVGQFIRGVFFQAFLILLVGYFIVKIVDAYFRPGTGAEVWQKVMAFHDLIEKGKGEWLPAVQELAFALIWLFCLPVIWALAKIESFIGFQLDPHYFGDLSLYLWGISVFVLSWVFWSTAYVRFLRLLGLWNPFWNVEGRKRGLLLRGFLGFRDWWEMSQHFGRGPTSKWASLPEVLSHRFCGGDVFLGRPKLFVGGMMRPIGMATEKHMVTIAGTGSGKSTAALIPNLCIHEGSLLCIDPKGELATITADRRGRGWLSRGMGQSVYILDPFGIVDQDAGFHASYNPFDEIARVSESDPDRAVSYAAKIAEALVRPMSQHETYWDNAAKTFIRGVILYILVHDPKKDLVRLRQLLMEGDIEGWRAAIDQRLITQDGTSPFEYLLDRMGEVREGQHGEVIAACASMVSMMGENQRGSVITTAQEHTAFLDLPEIRRVSERSDFLLEDLKRSRVSVYVCVPVNMVSGPVGRWLRMFVMLFIDMMTRIQEAPNPPVLLAIDEFPSLGKLDGIETVAPVLRSYGVRFWAVGQDIAQFMNVYPDVWTGFIGGAEAVQFMGLIHPSTVDFIVERLGQHEVREGGRPVGARPLLDRDQIGRFLAKSHKNQIIWYGSKRPMKLKICPYYEYLPWWYYWPDPRFREMPHRAFWRFIFRGWRPRLRFLRDRTADAFVEWVRSDPARVERARRIGDAYDAFADFIDPFRPSRVWWNFQDWCRAQTRRERRRRRRR